MDRIISFILIFCRVLPGIVLFLLPGLTAYPGSVPGVGSVPAPQLSVKHGFFSASFNLEITCPESGVRIFYTRDGSEPDINKGTLYTGPIPIEATSVIRAVSVRSDLSKSKVMTSTYLFPDDIIHQPNNPEGYPSTWSAFLSINGTAQGDYEMDPEMMADPSFAESVREALHDLPVISLVTDKGFLFSKTVNQNTGGIYIYTGTAEGVGYGWERPVSFEYFSAKDTASFQVDCGIQIQGGEGRRPEKSPKHSFRLLFKSEYGPAKLNYPLFGDDAVTEFNSIILRAGFNNTWIHHSHSERVMAQYLTDRWTKDTQRAMGYYSSHGNFVHLYINGLYWGVYNPSERMDNEFAESYLFGDENDYDVIKDYTEVADGNIIAWNRMMTVANGGLQGNEAYQMIQGNKPDGTPNPAIEPLVDVKSLADYMILNFYGGNTDWDHHNWVAIRNRVSPIKGFRFFCWDSEHMLDYLNTNILTENNVNCPSRVYQQLLQNNSFRRLFADRVQKLCFQGGPLTPGSAASRWSERTDQIYKAVLAESARWGDYRRDVHQYQTVGPFELYTRENHWLPRLNYMTGTYFPNRTEVFIGQLRKTNLFPAIKAPVYLLNNNTFTTNNINPGDKLSLTSDGGVVWYTTDGSDPAIFSPGISVSPTARMFTSAITLYRSSHFKARTFINGEWSPLNEQMFINPDDIKDLKITEINYHPENEGIIKDSVFEFIELKNTGTSTLSLEGIRFVKGIRYRFPAETYLSPGEFIVLSPSGKHFLEKYHFRPFDQFNGQLANEGEEIVLLSAEKDTLCSIKYDDENGWPVSADGDGKTLVPVDLNPSDDQNLAEGWRESYANGGSPGADDIYRLEKSTSDIITVYQNYPNPFSETTTISYSLYAEAEIQIVLYDLSGKPVTTLEKARKSGGFYSFEWNGLDRENHRMQPGIYFCRVKAGNSERETVITQKMIVIGK